jgi:hypothetical protein
MNKYRVNYKYEGTGCAYIEADSAKEAEYKFERGEFDPDLDIIEGYHTGTKIVGRTVIYKKEVIKDDGDKVKTSKAK